jgi:glutamate dehydrogenase (NAD(P)+)
MEKIEFITNEKLLELPVDVLVVASERTNCNKANAKLLLELASFGISSNVKNTEVLPDVLLNSGFSALSHLDWIQKMHGYKWAKEDVLKKLRISVIKSFKETKEVVDEMKITYRQAAYYLGIKRIIDMMMARGRI